MKCRPGFAAWLPAWVCSGCTWLPATFGLMTSPCRAICGGPRPSCTLRCLLSSRCGPPGRAMCVLDAQSVRAQPMLRFTCTAEGVSRVTSWRPRSTPSGSMMPCTQSRRSCSTESCLCSLRLSWTTSASLCRLQGGRLGMSRRRHGGVD